MLITIEMKNVCVTVTKNSWVYNCYNICWMYECYKIMFESVSVTLWLHEFFCVYEFFWVYVASDWWECKPYNKQPNKILLIWLWLSF